MSNEYKIKEQICEIGRRLYAKGFAAANDGNITVRLNDRKSSARRPWCPRAS